MQQSRASYTKTMQQSQASYTKTMQQSRASYTKTMQQSRAPYTKTMQQSRASYNKHWNTTLQTIHTAILIQYHSETNIVTLKLRGERENVLCFSFI